MNYKNEFPNYDDTINMPEGWIDTSWHNDACPSFEKTFGDTTFRLWCDYVDPERREMHGAMRFVIYTVDEIKYTYVGQADTIKEALTLINEENQA
jgi:hypothetical protein